MHGGPLVTGNVIRLIQIILCVSSVALIYHMVGTNQWKGSSATLYSSVLIPTKFNIYGVSILLLSTLNLEVSVSGFDSEGCNSAA